MNFLQWHDIMIFGLAIWRISSLFVNEDGPWNIFSGIRRLIGFIHIIKQDENKVVTEEIYITPTGYLGDLFSCIWCFSLVQSIIWYVAWLIEPDIMYLLMPFAIGAVAIIVDKFVSKE